VHEQQRDRRGRDARDARGHAQSFGPVAHQRLARLEAQRGDLHVVDVGGQAQLFEIRGAFDLGFCRSM